MKINLVSPFELKHLRKSIGATIPGMAHLLGLSGQNDSDTVRKLENGNKPISGPIQRLARYMQQGVSDSAIDSVLPKFLLGTDLEDKIVYEFVLHTRYPRFIAIVSDRDPSREGVGHETVSVDAFEWLTVATWIDEPVNNPVPLLQEAALYFKQYTKGAVG